MSVTRKETMKAETIPCSILRHCMLHMIKIVYMIYHVIWFSLTDIRSMLVSYRNHSIKLTGLYMSITLTYNMR